MLSEERLLIYALCFSDKDTDIQVVKGSDETLSVVTRSGIPPYFEDILGISKPITFKEYPELYGFVSILRFIHQSFYLRWQKHLCA